MDEREKTQKQKGPVAWMAGNSVASNLLMMVFLVGGFLCLFHIRQEIFPEFDPDTVRITVPYPGASPAEVEQGIVLAVEEAIEGLDGINEIVSRATEGSARVDVEIMRDADIQKISQDIKNEVDRISSFPEDAEEPRVVVSAHRHEVLSLVLYGDAGERILREIAEQMRDQILQLPGITFVELSGVRPLEISIEVSQANLRTYNLTMDEIADTIRKAAVEVPGGGIKTEGGEILLRMKERRDYGAEFADISILSRSDGTQLLLGDIATIVDGFKDSDEFAYYNGKPAVMLDVYRVGDQTPIQVADTLKTFLAEHEDELPPGIEMAIWHDRSQSYRQRLNLLLRNGFIGLSLVLVLLAIFLEARLAFWVAMGIPISFIGAFLFLPAMGISINMISMFAFIIALGIVVDAAIVVGENTYEYHRRGMPFIKAAITGTHEVMMPVIFSVLTNVATFLPLYFMPGTMGRIFKVIPLVVVTVFLISLIECLFMLPSFLAHQRDRERHGLTGLIHRTQRRFGDWFVRTVKNVYGPFLDKALRHRYLTLAVSVSILLLTISYIASGRLGMVLMPRTESDSARVTAMLPYGSSVEKTKAVQDILLPAAEKIVAQNGGDKLSRGIYAEVEGHISQIRIELTPFDVRPISTTELVALWREEVGGIPGVENLRFQSDARGPGSGASLTVELSHRDLEILEKASEELAEAISLFPNAKDINDGFFPGKQQIDFNILPAGLSLGLSAREVARQVRSSFYGSEALRQQRGRNEIKVMVRLPESERVSEHDLDRFLVRTSSGVEIPLREAVEVSRGRAYTSINRREGCRIVTVSADITPQDQTELVRTTLEAETLPKLVQKYPGLQYGYEGRQAEMAESLSTLYSGFIFALLVVYALLAIPLRSYTLPLIIMTTIPFGIVGAIFGHIIMGYSLSINSMMGMVALAGVVINNSLVLLDLTDREHKSGMSPRDAIRTASVRRFRPIILTTLTTFGGLSPMIFETSRQARFMIPMAISLGYGLLFATFVSLLIVPCLYLIIHDVKALVGVRVSEPALQLDGVRKEEIGYGTEPGS